MINNASIVIFSRNDCAKLKSETNNRVSRDMIKNPDGKRAAARITVITAMMLALMLCFALTDTALAAGNEDSAATPEYSKGVKQCMTCHKEGKEKPAHEIFLTPMGSNADPN